MPVMPTVTIAHITKNKHYYEWNVGFDPDDEPLFKSHVLELWEKDRISLDDMNEICKKFDDYYNKF